MIKNAFLTGSYAYGTPTKDSDIDLVVLVDEDVSCFLWDKSETSLKKLSFGKLNLILTLDEDHFNGWKDATEQLIKEKPVTREHAIKVIQELFSDRKLDLYYEIE